MFHTVSKFYNTKEFLELNAKWSKKLEKSGFEDIEYPNGTLKLWTSYFFKTRYKENVYEAKEEYYRLANQFLHDYKFKTALDKKIWKYHASGMSQRLIDKKIGRKIGVSERVIKRLFKCMVNKPSDESNE